MVRDELAKAAEQPEVSVTHTDSGNDPATASPVAAATQDGRSQPELTVTYTNTGNDLAGGAQKASVAPASDASNSGARILGLQEVPPSNYEPLGEQGRGGIGIVRRALDRRLDRVVAIKELQRESYEAGVRFEREMRITARLQHPGIVPVHEAGRWPDGSPFYSMKLVEGRSLKALIATAQTLPERLSLLPHVLAVAETIAYAHSKRVIHRDLKPSNVIVGSYGETIVIDWGLAKDLDDADAPPVLGGTPYRISVAEDLTAAGQVMGTPAYMPPEQAKGEEVDERADIYALGAILYHLLAGEAPYRAGSSAVILTQVLQSGPRDLEELVPHVPPELATIVRKAMARKASSRYSAALELVEDLRSFQTGQLVASHTYTPTSLISRWLRRHRGVVAIGAAATLVLVVAGVFGIRRILVAREAAESAQRLAENRGKAATARANELVLVQARQSLDRDPTSSLAWLKRYPPDAVDQDSARAIAGDAISRGVARMVLAGHRASVRAVAISPDGRYVATLAGDDAIRLWDAGTGALLLTSEVVEYDPLMRFSPDGRYLVHSGQGSDLVVITVSGLTTSRLKSEHRNSIATFAFSPDSATLISNAPDEPLVVWKTADWSHRGLSNDSFKGDLYGIAFTSDGQSFYSDGQDGVLRHWDLRGSVTTFATASHPVYGLYLSSDGRYLAEVESDGRVTVLNAQTKSARVVHAPGPAVFRALFEGNNKIIIADGSGLVSTVDYITGSETHFRLDKREARNVSLSPDHSYLAVATGVGHIVIRRLADGSSRTLLGHSAGVNHLAFSPDGTWFASVSDDKTARIWPMPSFPVRRYQGAESGVLHVDFAMQDRVLVADGLDGIIRSWDRETGNAHELRGHTAAANALSVARATGLAATGSWDGTVRIWDLRNASSQILSSHQGRIMGIDMAGDGGSLLSADSTGTVLFTTGATSLQLHQHEGEASAVALSKHQRWAASGGDDRIVAITDLSTHVTTNLSGLDAGVTALSIAASERFIAAGSTKGDVRIWQLPSMSLTRVIRCPGRIRALTFDESGTQLAIGDESGRILMAAAVDGPDYILSAHTDSVRNVVFSPDETQLASSSTDGTVRIWDLANRTSWSFRGHDNRVSWVAFSSDGHYLASSGSDGTILLWRTTDQVAIPRAPESLTQWLNKVTLHEIVAQQP